MSGFLLDTNVVSEMTKSRPNLLVISFLAQSTDLWLASLVVHELEFGLQLAPPGQRRDRLRAGISRFLTGYSDRILQLDRAAAEWAARFRADAVRSGRPPDLVDILIAGIAKAHDLTVATRNVRDFQHLDIDVFNPWDGQ
ncbi:MAG: type II toxin-antitoxin system VapC family toxin [Dehalococcoidia bacterium]|nr:type II toxin-antitoxin system VapC family toxin [Dehalococcoidia bacterium]